MPSNDDLHQLDQNRLVRVARALEAGGFYNAAKLLWAFNYSQQVRASNRLGLPDGRAELDGELKYILKDLEAHGAQPALLAALQRGREAALANRAIPISAIPPVFVCRSCGEILLSENSDDEAPDRCPGCGAWELTFREFPPVFYLEPLSPQVVLQALETAPGQVEGLFQGLNERQLAKSPKAGEWSLREVLFHLLVTQELLAGRVERMLEEDNPSLKGVAAWASEAQETLPADEMLEQYRISRQATVALLKQMPAGDWWRTGQHEEFGRVTILQQASYFAKHERSHLPQIAAILEVIGK